MNPGIRNRAGDKLEWLVRLFLIVGIVAATLIVYRPAWHGEILWDDDAHMTRADLRSAGGLWRIWFEPTATQQYYPLTHSVFWIQYKLWGEDTFGYHLVNIGFHVAVALLLVAAFHRLGIRGGWLAGAIFALHPVHVESVAWITELKNVLSGALVLAAGLVYLDFDKHRQKTSYAISLLLFGLALLSKTVTAMLPLALLVIFWWQRGSLKWRYDFVPLAPFFIIGAVAGLFTAWVERTLIGAEGSDFQFTFVERCLIAGRVILFYLEKLAWPANLTFIYPRWSVSQAVWWQFIFPLAVIALFCGLWAIRKRSRAPLAAMLLYCVWLFPAMGFVNVYPFRFSFVADHFQYLASVAMISLFAGGVGWLAARLNYSILMSLAVGGLVCSMLGVLTLRQCEHYRSIETLFRETLKFNPHCWLAHCNLGVVVSQRGEKDEAIAHYREALRLNPHFPEALSGLGTLLSESKRCDEAIEYYRAALRIEPRFAEAHTNWGVALENTGRVPEAVGHYREALRLRPSYAKAHYNLGNALQKMGQPAASIPHYHEALRLNPADELAYINLGTACYSIGQRDQAMQYLRSALRLRPTSELAHTNIAIVLHQAGKKDMAAEHYGQALQFNPDNLRAIVGLGTLLMEQGKLREAAVYFRKALAIQPDHAQARQNLDLIEATSRPDSIGERTPYP